MRKLLICLAALSGASAALAQSLPSPVFQNLTVDGAITAPEFPNLSASVEGTGVPGLDGGHWYLYNGFSAFDPTPTLRVNRNVVGAQTGTFAGGPYYAGAFQTTTGVNEVAYEWPLFSQVINYSNASTGAQHVAVAGYMLRNPPPNTAATTAASGTGSTATITFSGGATIPVGHSVAVAGVTPSGYNGNYKVTASSAGSVSFASTTTGAQTGAGTAVDISLAPGWASNFVCTDQAGEPDPVTACTAQELDSYTNYSGTDANKSRVTLQMMAGTGHISRGILQGTKGGGVYDRAYELDGSYGFGIDFTNGTFTGPVALLAPNQSIAFDANTSGVSARSLNYNSTATALQYRISGSTAFSVSDSGIASANSYVSNAGNNLGLTAPSGNSVQIGINGTSGVWTFDAGGFYPTSDNSRTLGAAADRWSTLYAANVGTASVPVTLLTATTINSDNGSNLSLTASASHLLAFGINGVNDVYEMDAGGEHPTSDNTRTSGTAGLRWATGYFVNLGASGTPISNIYVSAPAATIFGNPTGSTANAQNMTIQGLTDVSAPSPTADWMPIYNASSGTIKKVNANELITAFGSGVASFNSRTGVVVPVSGDYTTQQMTTIISGSAPAAGKIGEVISSSVAAGSGITPANNTAANITSVSLTAGHWECSGNVFETVGAGDTNQTLIGWISSASATLPSAPNGGAEFYAAISLTAAQNYGQATGNIFFNLSAPTTVYLGGYYSNTAGVSANTLFGVINCERHA